MAHYDLANIRKQCRISQVDLANRLGVSTHKIQYSEAQQGSMSYSSLIRLSIGASQSDFDETPEISWNGEALYDARKEIKLSQRQLAEIVGSDFRDISRWETGRNEPRPDMVEKLAKACSRNVSYFYSGSVEQTQISNILTMATSHVCSNEICIEIISRNNIRYDYNLTLKKTVSYAA